VVSGVRSCQVVGRGVESTPKGPRGIERLTKVIPRNVPPRHRHYIVPALCGRENGVLFSFRGESDVCDPTII
jgi:hypothetical protein